MRKHSTLYLLSAGLLLCGAAAPAFAQGPAGGPSERLQLEIRYVEALNKLGLPDYAEMVIADLEKAFPEARAEIKVHKLRNMLSLGKFEEVKKIIQAEPDQEAESTWAMRLTLADYYYAMGRYDDAKGVYMNFFKKYDGKPPASIASFYLESQYKFAQMLLYLKDLPGAAKQFESLAKLPMEKDLKRRVLFEYSELLVRMGTEAAAGSPERKKFLDDAVKTSNGLLWDLDMWFGKAIVLQAHVRVLEGDVAAANKLLNTYMPQLREIDDALREAQKETGEDWSAQSPVAECRYLMGVMMMDEGMKILAANEGALSEDAKKECRALLLGSKDAAGKAQPGAFQHLLNVFISFPSSPWAPDAGERSEQIREAALQRGLAKQINTQVTPAKLLEVARVQFQNAHLAFAQQRFDEAIAQYENILGKYGELVPDSIHGLSELARSYIEMWDPANSETDINELYADMVVGHLAERFCENETVTPQGDSALTLAGDQLRSIADLYGDRGQPAKREAVYDLFFTCYPRHAMAAPMLLLFAEAAYKADDMEKALGYYSRLVSDYASSQHSFDALRRMLEIYHKAENAEKVLETIRLFEERLAADPGHKGPDAVLVAYRKAQYMGKQASGTDLRSSDEEVVKAANVALRDSANAYKAVLEMLSDAQKAKYEVDAKDAEQNQRFREGAMAGSASCLALMTYPKEKIPEYRQKAIARYEELVSAFPSSEIAPGALMQIGTLWSMLEKPQEADKAFERLAKDYPDSQQNKLALYARATALMKLGYREEGVKYLRQMFDDPGRYPAGQMLSVGEELAKSREYENAAKAFDIAIEQSKSRHDKDVAAAGGDKEQVAKADAIYNGIRIPALLGKADILIAQKAYADAVTVLDAFIAEYPKSVKMLDAKLMLTKAASEAAVDIKDRDERIKMFNKAVDAVKDVRKYRNTPAELAMTDNDTGRILLRKAEAERRLGEDEAANVYTRQAIAHFITVAGSVNTADPAVAPHAEETFHLLIPLLMQMQEYADAKEYAEQSLAAFPKGRFATDIQNWLNECAARL